MPAYVLSSQAQDSLRSVRAYTLKHYREKQPRTYLKMLRDGMRETAKRPETAGKHTIYYRIRKSHIEVIDVLHQPMDSMQHR